MLYTVTCAICGRQFQTVRKNARYCSEACRKIHRTETRRAWEERTGFKEKQAERMKQRRRAEAEAEHLEQVKQDKKAERNARRREQYKARKRAAEAEKILAGDDWLAIMRTAKKSDPAYWQAFQAYECGYYEAMGFYAGTTVNGLSVYDPEFPEKVPVLIRSSGSCQITAGRGAKRSDDRT